MCLFLRTEGSKVVNLPLKLFFLGIWICSTNYDQYFNEGLQASMCFVWFGFSFAAVPVTQLEYLKYLK